LLCTTEHAAASTPTVRLLTVAKQGAEYGTAVWSLPPTVLFRVAHVVAPTVLMTVVGSCVVAAATQCAETSKVKRVKRRGLIPML